MTARCLTTAALGCLLMIAGCQTTMTEPWVRHAPLHQAFTAVTPPIERTTPPPTATETQPPPTITYVDPPPAVARQFTDQAAEDRFAETRGQVLSFINRLEVAKPPSPSPIVDHPPAGPPPSAPAVTPTDHELQQDVQNPSIAAPASAQVDHSTPEAETYGPKSVRTKNTQPPTDGRPRVLSVWTDPVDPDSLNKRDTRTAVPPQPPKTATADPPSNALALTGNTTDHHPNAAADRWRDALRLIADGEEILDSEPADATNDDTLYQRAVETVTAVGRAVADPEMEASDTLHAVDALRNELRKHADLEITAVDLCSAVRAFGLYDPLPDGAFRAFSRNQAIVYLALRNFTSERTPDGRYRSLLSDRFEILTPDGQVVWTHSEPAIEDLSRQRREDFFIAQRIVVGTHLAEGSYVLKVTAEDKLAGKQTQHIHPFRVSPTRTSAATR